MRWSRASGSQVAYEIDAHSHEEGADMSGRLKDPDTPEGLALSEEIRDIVHAAIGALPEDLRTAIVLRELEGLSYEEIADDDAMPGRHGALAHLSGPRGD